MDSPVTRTAGGPIDTSYDLFVLLGADLPAWLLLAFGAAMAFGSALALVRPPADMKRPPLPRSVIMIGIGLIAAVWALASLVKG